ncbi:hypothetical protein CMV_030227, partial [Castanea mollissima]
ISRRHFKFLRIPYFRRISLPRVKRSLQEKAAVLISSFLKRIGEPKVCAD